MKPKPSIFLFLALACSLGLYRFSSMTAQASNDSSISTKLTGERNNNLLANIPQSISSDGQLNNKPLVFVLMGQSNACGAADIQDSQDYLTQHPNIRKYIQSTSNSGEKFTQTLVPFCEQWKDNSDGKVSLMNSFLERMVEQFPNQKFDVLNCSIPGSSIQSYEKGKVVDMNFYGNDFQTGDRNIYEHCVRRTQEVLEQGGGTLAGVLFHQGETDNAASYWKPAVENLVLNFRQDLNSNVPFIFGHLAPVPQYENHNQIIDSLENTSNLIGVVSSQGLSYQSDNIHFDQQGSLGLGYRYAEKMLEFLRDEEEVSKTRAKNNNFLISSSKHKAKNQQAGLHI